MNRIVTILLGLLVTLAVTFTAAACGDDDDDDDADGGTSTPASTEGAAVTVGDLEITGPFARGAIDRGAVFFTVTNMGTEDDALIAAKSPAADTVELHETVTEGSSSMMRQVDQIDVPAGGEAVLEPGGLHVMLLDLTGELAKGDMISITLEFENAGTAEIEAKVMEYSDEPMGNGEMNQGEDTMGDQGGEMSPGN
jgi:hypothetical protein